MERDYPVALRMLICQPKDSILVSADINAAVNIAHKQKPADRQLCRGVLATAQQIHVHAKIP
ncbi:MAG: hypothetical protein DUD39_13060 [Coriobacteriaceae bacterium]|nr:MAG: hypothetical protein DUD39_13060 [Coriobacteriaceae bacterium]